MFDKLASFVRHIPYIPERVITSFICRDMVDCGMEYTVGGSLRHVWLYQEDISDYCSKLSYENVRLHRLLKGKDHVKTEQEVRSCDCCGKEQTFNKGSIGGAYFPGWISVKRGDPSISSSRDMLSEEKHFCSLDCTVEYLSIQQEESCR